MCAMEKMDFDLYMDILAARKKLGLSCQKDNGEIDHPLVGRHLRRIESGEIFVVKKAVRHWYWGYYTALLIEGVVNQSGCLIAWTNESSDLFAARAATNQSKYEVMP